MKVYRSSQVLMRDNSFPTAGIVSPSVEKQTGAMADFVLCKAANAAGEHTLLEQTNKSCATVTVCVCYKKGICMTLFWHETVFLSGSLFEQT